MTSVAIASALLSSSGADDCVRGSRGRELEDLRKGRGPPHWEHEGELQE